MFDLIIATVLGFINNNWTLVATVSGFLFALAVKILFDFHLAAWIVRYFYWVPVRWLFREKIPNLNGSWSHIWRYSGASHVEDASRHDNSTLYQLGRYVYCNHYASGILYKFFGSIRGGFVSGIWFDPKSALGYAGAFHLRIVNEKQLLGHWIGHSVHEKPGDVNGNMWEWTRNADGWPAQSKVEKSQDTSQSV